MMELWYSFVCNELNVQYECDCICCMCVIVCDEEDEDKENDEISDDVITPSC